MDVVEVMPQFEQLMDLLLESYKYDKIKVRIVVINYQIVSQIFKIK